MVKVLDATDIAKLRAKMTPPDISGDEAKQVIYDVTDGIEPKDSKLIYTAAMLRFRDAIERDRATWPAGTVVQIPDL